MENFLENDAVFYIVTFLSSIGGGILGVIIGMLLIHYLLKRRKK